MIEIKIWGRGGQGAVTTGQLIAIGALYDKKYCQTFPMFGVERRGAPVQAFARLDKEPINLRSQIYNPDVVIVLDPTLIKAVDVAEGIKDNGVVIINTSKKPKDIKLKKKGIKVFTVDASSVAMKIFSRPIVNTPILGAFSAITKLVSLRSLQKAVDERFSSKGKQLADLNKKAIKEVHDNTKVN